jgi:hypothetical protein
MQAGDQLPSLSSEAGFLFEFSTSGLLYVGILWVNGASWQFEKERAGCVALLPD